MSMYPVYECMVKGSVDSSDYDIFDKRSLRATSALPDSVYLRGYTSVPKSLVQRSVSVAREILEEPETILSSRQYKNYLDTKESLDRSSSLYSYSSKLNDSYSSERSNLDSISYPFTTYTSTRGYTIPLYRRRFPSSYWWAYPYSSTLPWKSNYTTGLDDDLYSSSFRKDAYSPYYRGPFRGQTRYPWRDWRTEYPYKSYSPVRPRYIYPTVRSSYLYPKYI